MQLTDSFKRACFNWGIGRELYTSPFIWISDKKYIKNSNGKLSLTDKFSVKEITVVDKVITELEIIDSKGTVVFSTKPKKATKKEQDKAQEYLNSRAGMIEKLTEYVTGEKLEKTLKHFGVEAFWQMTDEQLKEACEKIFKK